MAHRIRSIVPAPLRLALLLLAAMFLVTGCGRNAKKKNPDEGVPVAELYQKAHYEEWSGATGAGPS